MIPDFGMIYHMIKQQSGSPESPVITEAIKMQKYKYETHLHTSPVSKCAKADVRDSLQFYKDLGYDGVFITNHFLDGNINVDRNLPYEERIHFYFSDYEEGVKIGKEIGIKVFCGVEMSYGGTDFLIYGLDKNWYLQNPQIMEMKKSDELNFLMQSGALVIQAHPYREAGYIDHIRLYPRNIQGVEVINANRTDFENQMAELYAEHYDLLKIAGTDNHLGSRQKKLAGVCFETPLGDEQDFIKQVREGQAEIFEMQV